MIIKKSIFICLLIILLPYTIYSQGKQKRLFIKKFKAKQGISLKLSEKFRDKLILYFFEEGASKYRVLSESDIKIMYKQAEELLKIGCNAEECLIQIAYTINADIIIYGKMEKSEAKINIFAQSLVRDRSTDELSKSSVISISFFESQMDWYAREIVKKLINSDYFIDESKAPLEIKVEVIPELLKSTELKIKKLEILKFTTDDTALQTILDILKGIVKEGDNHFQKKNYEKAGIKYKEVLGKVKTKVSSDIQYKLINFKKQIYDRIAGIYYSQLQKIIKQGDIDYKNHQYDKAFQKYLAIDEKINSIDITEVKNKLTEFKEIAKQRRDLVRIIHAKLDVIKADSYYKDYKFVHSLKYYEKALKYLPQLEIKTNYKYSEFFDEVKCKKETTKKTGYSYFKNKVYSYRDKINVFNVKDEVDKARATLNTFYSLITTSYFTDEESRMIYNEMEELIIEPEEKQRLKNWIAKKYLINFEFGAGHMFNSFLLYRFTKFKIGLGFSCTFDKINILGKELSQMVLTPMVGFEFNLLEKNYIWLDIRERIGYMYIKLDKYSENGTIFFTDFLAGYKNFFGILSMPYFIGKNGSAVLVRIGMGYQIRI